MSNVLLSVCTHRTIDIDVMGSIMLLAGETKHTFGWSPVRGDALISRARSRVASYFLLDRNEDILFFVDDDVVFQPSDAVKIVDNVSKGMDICGGMYVQKKTLDKTCVFFDGQTVTFKKDAEPVEVEALATGFIAIHRRVFEMMATVVPLCHPGTLNFYPFFDPFPVQKNGKWIHLSEDWAFCQRARNLGFKVWLDPSIFLGHKGEAVYDLSDKARPKKETIQEITLK